MNKISNNSTILVIITVVMALITGCSLEKKRKINLSDGYKVMRMHGGANALISSDKKIVVLPNVVYAIDNTRYILGIREKVIYTNEALYKGQQHGYFLYDKKRKILRDGYTRNELLHIIKKEKINLTLQTRLAEK